MTIKSEWVFSSIFKLVSLMSRSTKSVTDSDESQLRHASSVEMKSVKLWAECLNYLLYFLEFS